MLGELPFFLAVGFCLGLLQRRFATLLFIGARRHAGWLDLVLRGVAVAMLVFVAVLLVTDLRARPEAVGLSFAAVLVGWAGGRWFHHAPWGRDKIVFVAAAGLFVAIGAFEYDYRGLSKLTKLSAGSVDLEFSDSGRTQESGPISGITDASTKPFPGRNRLDLAVYYLVNLPQMMSRDEEYAEMFSGFDVARATLAPQLSGKAAEKFVWEPASEGYYNYYNEKIFPFVTLLDILQKNHKGEIASNTVDPAIIYNLRLVYERAKFLRPTDSNDDEFAISVCLGAKRVAAEVEIWPRKPEERADGPERFSDCAKFANSAAKLPRLDGGRVYTADDAYVFVAYLAMTAALAEFAMDNRERAIQLLDDFLVQGAPYDRKEYKDKAADPTTARAYGICAGTKSREQISFCQIGVKRLLDMRRLVVRARLETLIDNIIEVSDNWGLKAIRISLLNRAIGNMDKVMVVFSRTTGFDELAFFGAHVGETGSHCRLGAPTGTAAQKNIARWMAAATILLGNALQAAADRPDVVNVKPFLVPILDGYAAKVAAFDVDCVNRLTHVIQDTLRSNILAATASYWEAKGRQFGAAASDVAHLAELGLDKKSRIAALCAARKTFQFARQIYRPDLENNPAREDEMTIDQRGSAYAKPTTEDQMASGYARTQAALDNLPVGDVEAICR